MSFCGEDVRRRNRIIAQVFRDGFLLSGLIGAYNGDTIESLSATGDRIDDGIALIDRRIKNSGLEFDACEDKLKPYNATRQFLVESRDALSRGEKLPEMPKDIEGYMRHMLNTELSLVKGMVG